ncbi:MAG: hypothetical protein A2W91_00125 [Bacteroidetes bacterium GWF2_38_335]|nr:MAG: hypothetical protein A2W91_00125 [Bacteroidetes bacterium GWF2_38_335]OFY79727.1 MAG: hypothetical protein A2281_09720 [Bacteroidetes bacterium RIFOXYA12_FULL_38_20]HBS87567.1 hypothetical protein [Bacteroidales bacterium]
MGIKADESDFVCAFEWLASILASITKIMVFIPAFMNFLNNKFSKLAINYIKLIIFIKIVAT